MIHINLLPTQTVVNAASRRKELGLAGGILLSVLIAVLASYSFQSSQLHQTNETVNRLQAQVTTLTKQHQEIEKLKHQKKDLEDKIHVVNLLTSPKRRTAPVHMFDDLSTSTPEFLWLTEYSENKGTTQIKGKAIDNQTIATFARNLANSPYFRSVEIRETQQEAQTSLPVSRGVAEKNQDVKASSVMMTKFLIEAAVNYGKAPESANSPAKETDPKKAGVEDKTAAKAAAVAPAGQTYQQE